MTDPTMAAPDMSHVPGIGNLGSTGSAPRKSNLSPIRRPKTALSPKLKSGLKGSMSTGQLRRNRISFGDATTLEFEKEIEDEEHMNSVWYSKQEMKGIRKELKKSIKKGEISRGLEPYEGDMGAETKQKRLNHMYSILDLQKQQQESGKQCDKAIQMLSRAMSANDIGRARKLASMDSTQAFQEYNDHDAANPLIRTSSRGALDNFRKTLNNDTQNQRMGGLVLGLGSGAKKKNANATFGNSTKKKKTPNLLLQAMANKKKNTADPPSNNNVA